MIIIFSQKASIQYVDIPAYNDDDDDDAFLPPGTPTARPPPYANVTSTAGTGEKQHTLSHSNSHTSYVNIEGAHSQSNGERTFHVLCLTERCICITFIYARIHWLMWITRDHRTVKHRRENHLASPILILIKVPCIIRVAPPPATLC